MKIGANGYKFLAYVVAYGVAVGVYFLLSLVAGLAVAWSLLLAAIAVLGLLIAINIIFARYTKNKPTDKN